MSAWIKKLKKTDSNLKKMGVCFLQLLIRALLRPQIAIRRRANISRVNTHIRIVINNAKYLITWSNFVRIGLGMVTFEISGLWLVWKKIYAKQDTKIQAWSFQGLVSFKSKLLTKIQEAIILSELLTILVFKISTIWILA